MTITKTVLINNYEKLDNTDKLLQVFQVCSSWYSNEILYAVNQMILNFKEMTSAPPC